MDRFFENTVFIPCSVTVYFGTLPFFLCLERLHCSVVQLGNTDNVYTSN